MRADPRDDAKPPPQLEALDYFVGIWSFKGRMEASTEGPARDVRGSMICRWELGKFFLSVSEDDEQSLKYPRRRQSRAYWGYDAGTKLYTCATFFFGGARIVGTSPGWQRDKLTFSGTMTIGGESLGVRQSFTQKNDEHLIVRLDLVGPDGQLTRRLEENCHREGEG